MLPDISCILSLLLFSDKSIVVEIILLTASNFKLVFSLAWCKSKSN